MTDRDRFVMRRSVAVAIALALIATGAIVTYLLIRTRTAASEDPARADRSSPVGGPATRPSETAIMLSPDAMARAGIEIGTVTTASDSSGIRIPAVVEANAYRSVVVTPVVAGRVTQVSAEAGQQVRRGEALARIYSPELAEVQSRYLASLAQLEAHARELRRTERLVEIGAASRQELERVHAEHTAATTDVQTHRARLTLLGMSNVTIGKLSPGTPVDATVAVASPIDGVVTQRQANAGLNVEAATPLFTVVDLSTVWLVGDLYERDFSRVRVGSRATVTTTAYPELLLEGRVSFIDPQVNAATRTARVRVEVPNPGRQLRFGMYADMQIGDGTPTSRPRVPRAAVQMIGDRAVLYVQDSSGRLSQRHVELGAIDGDSVEITKGVQAGERIVVRGSFSVRAEWERQGLQPTGLSVTVLENGFDPSTLTVEAGVPARIVFVRTSEKTCATEITVPAFNIRRPLPLNQPVEIEFTPAASGKLEFVCGMAMLRGTIIVR